MPTKWNSLILLKYLQIFFLINMSINFIKNRKIIDKKTTYNKAEMSYNLDLLSLIFYSKNFPLSAWASAFRYKFFFVKTSPLDELAAKFSSHCRKSRYVSECPNFFHLLLRLLIDYNPLRHEFYFFLQTLIIGRISTGSPAACVS